MPEVFAASISLIGGCLPITPSTYSIGGRDA